jgi:spore maturation protein CgeB
LLCRLPVIIASFAPVEKMMTDFHFGRFRDAGALAIAHTPEELQEIVGKLSADTEARARMSEAGWEFMRKNFSFDGHASERIAELVRGWSKRTTT